MASFVISKRPSGDYKFIFTSRKGKTIFTSKGFVDIAACESAIQELRDKLEEVEFRRFKTPSGKFFFKLIIDENVRASSRRYTTELRVLKGIDEIKRDLQAAEILDFSEQTFVFPELDV